jgi:16S rRNA (uracil1498-N3)-methyltransferase
VRRLFVPGDRLYGATVTVDGDAHRHLARVLRARAGDRVTLFDGAGGEVDAEVVAVERAATRLALGARRTVAPAAGARVVLLQALARGERMDLIVQKTTELGVSRVVPVTTERTMANSQPRRARWDTIAREAARQCGRADVPAIDDTLALPDALALTRANAFAAAPMTGTAPLAAEPAAELRLALWESSRGAPLRQALHAAARTVILLVGPEGGLAEAEVAAARDAGFQVVGLGPRILRVETAAVVAVALAQAATGGLD